MATLYAAEGFFESVAQITSPQLQDQLINLVSLIEAVPTIGSALNRDSVKEDFGGNCLTAQLRPFLLVYEYDEKEDAVMLYRLIHQRQVK